MSRYKSESFGFVYIAVCIFPCYCVHCDIQKVAWCVAHLCDNVYGSWKEPPRRWSKIVILVFRSKLHLNENKSTIIFKKDAY